MPEWIIALLSAVVGALVGAYATGQVQYRFWKRQHDEEVRSLEEREIRREKVRAAERLREIAVLLIELARSPVDGSHIEKTQATTATYIERSRLQREFVNATMAAREAFPGQDRHLTIFEKMLAQEVARNPAPDAIKRLEAELGALLENLKV